jgi:hypothetical protein
MQQNDAVQRVLEPRINLDHEWHFSSLLFFARYNARVKRNPNHI